MKNKLGARVRALLVAAVLILAIYLVVPVSARKNYLAALGTIDGYVDVNSSVIVGGHWSVTVKDGVLQYTAMYHELNLLEIEDSPYGSVDIFSHILTTDDPDDYEFKGNGLTFSGWMNVTKIWMMDDWTNEVKTWESLVSITITRNTFFLDYPPPGPGPGEWDQDWDMYGTTTRYK